VVTAGRDGLIAVWDLRMCGLNRENNHPVLKYPGSHSAGINSSKGSVSSAIFLPRQEHLIASVGQPDYSIKVWDTRYAGRSKKPQMNSIKPPLSGRRERAFLSLCADSLGQSIFAVSSDNHVYEYCASSFSSELVNVYTAPQLHTSGSFYIQVCISPDDNYLLCGSMEGEAYVWPVGKTRERAIVLGEQSFEVSCVAWSKNDFIFTGGEDYHFRLWRPREGHESLPDALGASVVKFDKKKKEAINLVRFLPTNHETHSNNFPEWPGRVFPKRLDLPSLPRTPLNQIKNKIGSDACNVARTPTSARSRQISLDLFLSASPVKKFKLDAKKPGSCLRSLNEI
jgi:WD40 repeat protein